MELNYFTIFFYILISTLVGLMAYFIARYSQHNPQGILNLGTNERVINFFQKYPWIITIIVFILFILFILFNLFTK